MRERSWKDILRSRENILYLNCKIILIPFDKISDSENVPRYVTPRPRNKAGVVK